MREGQRDRGTEGRRWDDTAPYPCHSLIIRLSISIHSSLSGYAVGSLALVADSFHMLNDVMSLIVAFYALKVSTATQPPLICPSVCLAWYSTFSCSLLSSYCLQLSSRPDTTSDPRYSYGWQRAEILGALINGVFLLALCFSIFMEAIERFVNVTGELRQREGRWWTMRRRGWREAFGTEWIE